MPSTNSRNPWTKCWRDCSPSLTISMPASSCSLIASRVASSLPASSSAPDSFQVGHSLFGSASHAGFGRLPGERRVESRQPFRLQMSDQIAAHVAPGVLAGKQHLPSAPRVSSVMRKGRREDAVTPGTAFAQIDGNGWRRAIVRTPPFQQVLWLRPETEDEFARGIDLAHQHDFAAAHSRADITCHSFPPCSSGSRHRLRACPGFRSRKHGSSQASRRRHAAMPAPAGRAAIELPGPSI